MNFHLITKADDYGRFDAAPRVVLGACFPQVDGVSVDDVSTWLAEMTDAQLIRLYQANGRQLGYFVTWEEHQGKPRAQVSKYPDPPAVVRARRRVRTSVGKRGRSSTDVPVVRSSSSINRNRSSEVQGGPQQIGAVISEMARKLHA